MSNRGFYIRARKFADGRAMGSVAPCGNELEPFEVRFFTNNSISPVDFDLHKLWSDIIVQIEKQITNETK